MADAVAYRVVQLLTVIHYEVVKCRIKGMAHWVRAQGLPQRAPYKQNTFFGRNAYFRSATITFSKNYKFFWKIFWALDPIWY